MSANSFSNDLKFFKVRQTFDSREVEDPAERILQQFADAQFLPDLQGKTVAISAGSRGIANIAKIIKAIASSIRDRGGVPFVVPAMGSHGGGTAEGQQKVLENYSITEEFCECEIRSSMDVIEVCRAQEGFPVFFDREASEADYVVVCGRIKPHTDFTGPIQSGLMKMMLIGLGKHEGARTYHKAIKDFTFDQIVRSVAREVIEKCNVLCGVAILENGYEKTSHLEVVPPHEIEPREEELLQMATEMMPSLPFDRADLLIVDEIGKEISGSGLDTNIVGRKHYDHFPAEHEFPKIKRIAVRRLTEATHGNATGIGMVEFCRTSLLDQMNVESTRINCLTSGHVTAAMIPVDFSTDRQIIDEALNTVGFCDPETAKVLWIRNTLHLTELCCSSSFYREATNLQHLEIVSQPEPLQFGEDDNLIDF